MLPSGVALLANMQLGVGLPRVALITCPSVCPFQTMSTKVLRWIFVKNKINGDFNSSCSEVFCYSARTEDLTVSRCLPDSMASTWPDGSTQLQPEDKGAGQA